MTDEGSASPPDPEPVAEVSVPEVAPVAEPTPVEPTTAPILESPPTPEPVVQEVSEPEAALEPPPAAPSPSSTTPPAASPPKVSAKNHMLTVVRARKQERLEKIVALARERKSITNNDVQKLLTISDTTATNYLNALVLAGRLRRSGHDGGAKYEAI